MLQKKVIAKEFNKPPDESTVTSDIPVPLTRSGIRLRAPSDGKDAKVLSDESAVVLKGTYPQVQKRYVMLIDMTRCIGCHTCAIACKLGNNLPQKVKWNQVLTFGGRAIDTPHGTFPNLEMRFLTLACQHCEEPACVKACPAGATYKREDGIVMQDYDKCLGCGMCIMTCPYRNVRTYNEGRPQYDMKFAVGDQDVLPQQKGTVSKCTFCHNRVDQGLVPNCVEVCPARARFFGDVEDASSEVYQLLKTRKHTRLQEGKGTGPSVYYLME